MQERFDAEVELIRSRGGAFEVRLEGALLFSKLEEGRYPTNEEIEALVATG